MRQTSLVWRRCGLFGGLVGGLLWAATAALAAEPVTLDNVESPAANDLDEPLAKEFSLERAVTFLDAAALTWQKERQCFTCHTNYAFLYARPLVTHEAPAHQTVRQFAHDLVEKRWVEKGPRWTAEVVATAAALAFNDAATSQSLHPVTRQALDRMWTVQRDDGGWTWLNCGWPPMESDDEYGAGLAALAVSVAPMSYRESDGAKAGILRLKRYLNEHPAPTLHHSAMLLWANSCWGDWLTSSEQDTIRQELLDLQRADGGWALASLGKWQRDDGTPQSPDSDGYGTGFVVYVLHRAGLPADDPRLQRGISWLKQNQRDSGRWITRSLKKDSRHFISHAGTAFAIMALQVCDNLPGAQPQP